LISAPGGDGRARPGLDERLVAEQDERRRLGELIHDGPVQHLAAIAQMLDAAAAGAAAGDAEGVHPILVRALALTREASGDLRELVSGLEPDALREHGLATAVALLAQRLAARRGIAVHAEVDTGAALGEAAAVGLYQIVRESLDQAVRRGPPTHISVDLTPTAAGGVELVVRDNGSGERRQAVLDGLAERAESLNATFAVEQRPGEGTVVQVTVPPSAARR
jgi:two-component system, NarL family, sensor kinase